MAKIETLQSIPGMDDVMPEGFSSPIYDSSQWVALKRLYSEWAELHGYRYIETPVLEYTELFKRTAGETSDIVSKEMYTFEDRGGRTLSMRPEGSAAVCRAVIQHGIAMSGTQTKYYYIAPMFRSERPQRGRYRQHTQLGLEIFRETEPSADAETIAVLIGFFRRIGLRQITLNINSVGTPACRPRYREILIDYLRKFEDKLSEDSLRRLNVNPMRILDSKAPEDQEIADNAPKMLDYLDDESAAHFEAVKAALDRLNIQYQINKRMVRGLDYYTKTAFEVTCDSLEGSIRVIAGGGRYDGLVEQIGGTPTPAVGFGSSIERTLLALESQGVRLEGPRDSPVVMAYFDEAAKLDAMAIAQQLREAGVEVDFPHKTRALGKQLKSVAQRGARLAVIVGGDEWQRGEIAVKDLEARTQTAIPREQIVEHVTQSLRRN